MKITAARVTPLSGETPDTGWPGGAPDNMYALVELETDEGIVGVGSCFTTAPLAQASMRLLEPLLIGRCALEPERLSETLHQTTHWFGRGGAVTVTISGVDIALWDILGKATGQSVARLLGGVYRERIRVYASLLFAEPPDPPSTG